MTHRSAPTQRGEPAGATPPALRHEACFLCDGPGMTAFQGSSEFPIPIACRRHHAEMTASFDPLLLVFTLAAALVAILGITLG